MKFDTVLLVISLFCMSFIISCCSTKSGQQQVGTQAVIAPFTIDYSEAGGLTGLKQTYQLQSTGTAAMHQQLPGKTDSVMWAGTLSAEDVAGLQKELQACGLSAMSLNGRGNMTSRLVYATADTSYEFSWAGAGAAATIPDALKSWVLNFKSFFNPKKSTPKK